jgi:CRISP-associated protein Cas1
MIQSLYITENGLFLKKRSNRIVVRRGKEIVQEIPFLDLKRIVIFGHTQVSTQLLKSLSEKGVDVAFLTANGRFKFRIVSETSKNIYLRMAQHDRHRDQAFKLHLGRILVRSKIRNQRGLLLRSRRNRPDIFLDNEITALGKWGKMVDTKETVEKIMGLEGMASKTYFQAYGKLLKNEFKFTNRAYHPPPDPVNALLSFGYMLLYNELNSLIEACGFDPFLGFLHSPRYGRSSLATDLIEELRSPVIDRLTLYLINKNVIKLNQFNPEGNGVRMDDKARNGYLRNYEKFMTASFIDARTRKRMYFRKIIKDRIQKLENCLLDNSEYQPYVFYG